MSSVHNGETGDRLSTRQRRHRRGAGRLEPGGRRSDAPCRSTWQRI